MARCPRVLEAACPSSASMPRAGHAAVDPGTHAEGSRRARGGAPHPGIDGGGLGSGLGAGGAASLLGRGMGLRARELGRGEVSSRAGPWVACWAEARQGREAGRRQAGVALGSRPAGRLGPRRGVDRGWREADWAKGGAGLQRRMEEKGEKNKRGGEKGFLFLIKHNGMKTKGVGEDSKGDRIKSNGVWDVLQRKS